VPIPFLAAAGVSLLGSGINALSNANTASRNERAQRNRQRQIDAGAAENANVINSGLGQSAGLLQQLANSGYNTQRASVNGFQFDPVTAQTANVGVGTAFQSNPNGIGADNVDIGQLFSGADAQGFNVGQDALMQFLRADPSSRMEGTNGVLQEIAATGLPSDLSSVFAAANQVNSVNNADLLSQVTGRAGSVGQRFGSASQRIAGDTARRLANEQALQNSQLALQAAEAASGRRLSAASQLGSFGLQGQQLQLQGANQLMAGSQARTQLGLQAALANQQNQQFGANLGQQNAQFNAAAGNQMQSQNLQMALQASLANAAAGNRANEFNAQTGFAVNQGNNAQLLQALFGNNQQTLAERAQQMGGIQAGAQAQQQQAALLNQLLGIRSGVQTPQLAQTQPGNVFGDLASLMAGYNRFGGGNSVPSMPNVFIPQVDIGPVR
jgi:hypothetical protein